MVYHLFFGSEASLEYTSNRNLDSEEGLVSGDCFFLFLYWFPISLVLMCVVRLGGVWWGGG